MKHVVFITLMHLQFFLAVACQLFCDYFTNVFYDGIYFIILCSCKYVMLLKIVIY